MPRPSKFPEILSGVYISVSQKYWLQRQAAEASKLSLARGEGTTPMAAIVRRLIDAAMAAEAPPGDENGFD
jgi:hypothetical protein